VQAGSFHRLTGSIVLDKSRSTKAHRVSGGERSEEGHPGQFRLQGDRHVGFLVAAHDASNGIVADDSGNAYVSGRTASANLPTSTGAFQETFAGVQDGFVAKVSADGSRLVYLTYIGGSADDFGRRIAVDRVGRAYVVGRTGELRARTAAAADWRRGRAGEP
jgi:hypothetical protein